MVNSNKSDLFLHPLSFSLFSRFDTLVFGYMENSHYFRSVKSYLYFYNKLRPLFIYIYIYIKKCFYPMKFMHLHKFLNSRSIHGNWMYWTQCH
jgi:hypothetical protein